MKLTRRQIGFSVAASLAGCAKSEQAGPPDVSNDADLLAHAIVFDAHSDAPGRMMREGWDLGERKIYNQCDIPRMREGGISAVFFAVFTSPRGKTEPEATKIAFDMLDEIVREVGKFPDDLVIATSTDEILQAKQDGKISIVLSLEGGHMIDGSLANLRKFHELGIRSMGLMHGLSTAWAQSAESEEGPGGLTDFGLEIVAELNRLGIVVDLAHGGDETFFQAVEASTAPIIHSHSACRAICDSPRNLSDDMLKALAKNDGVLAIGYYNGMIVENYGQPRPDLSDLEAKPRPYERNLPMTANDASPSCGWSTGRKRSAWGLCRSRSCSTTLSTLPRLQDPSMSASAPTSTPPGEVPDRCERYCGHAEAHFRAARAGVLRRADLRHSRGQHDTGPACS